MWVYTAVGSRSRSLSITSILSGLLPIQCLLMDSLNCYLLRPTRILSVFYVWSTLRMRSLHCYCHLRSQEPSVESPEMPTGTSLFTLFLSLFCALAALGECTSLCLMLGNVSRSSQNLPKLAPIELRSFRFTQLLLWLGLLLQFCHHHQFWHFMYRNSSLPS